MKKNRLSLPLGMLVLLIVASLLTGCFKEAVPDVTDTPVGTVQADQLPEEEGTPDMMATGIARSAQMTAEAGETSETGETPVSETSTPLPHTPTSTPTPSTTAAATNTPVPASPTQTPPPTGEVKHTVQAGENLFRIALHYGTTVEAIASANGIANPALIYVGQELTISSSGVQPPPPGGTTYVVQPGDNLFRIALSYNMSYITLAQYNGIANPASIYVGQVIRIP